jgi:hypothetical protein
MSTTDPPPADLTIAQLPVGVDPKVRAAALCGFGAVSWCFVVAGPITMPHPWVASDALRRTAEALDALP